MSKAAIVRATEGCYSIGRRPGTGVARLVPGSGLIALLLLSALLVSCGSSGDDRPAVKPIEDILDGPIRVVDITGTSATVRVDTSIDVVCSVVYGTDEDYGGQSTDFDMGGGAHSNHAALMRGLQPDTEYHYRLQGTGSDGAFYVSDDMTFRTAPASQATQDLGTNVASLAAGASVVAASSSFSNSPAWQPENALDEDPATEWSSNGDGDDAFMTIQLAQATELSAIGIWTRTMGASAQIMQFQVVTDDSTVLGPFDLPDSSQMHIFPVSATARELRFEVVQSSGGNTGLVEFAAYAVE